MHAKRWLILITLILLGILVFSLSQASTYRVLKQGMEGQDVLNLKRAMYWLGYFTNQQNLTDQYNATMVERVKQLQKNNGLEETGIADEAFQELVYSGNAIKTSTAPKASPVPTATPTPVPPKSPVIDPEFPERTEEGFLAPEVEEEEFVFIDKDDGRWIYLTHSLSIDVKRYNESVTPLEWFEIDIYDSEESPLSTYLQPGYGTYGKAYDTPVVMARAAHAVLAFSDDNFGDRWNGGAKPGIIIRDGQIIKEETFKAYQPTFPNLEVLAVFEDGSLKTFLSNEYTAQEYLDMGVRTTYAFGPILVQDGELSEYMLRDEYYTYHEPRLALGMIEPHHYFLLVANGRASTSKGVYLTWLADKMLEKGVTEALNLDGGGTVALVFMGQIINKSMNNLRETTSITYFGTSDLVPTR